MKKILLTLLILSLMLPIYGRPKDSLERGLYNALLLAAFPGQATSNYFEPGGARWVIGGEIDVASGGEIDIESGGAFKLAGTAMTTQLGYLSGVTAGTAAASKCVVLGASSEIATITTATITNINAGASGSGGSFKLYPATASKGYLALTCQNQTGNTAVTIDADAMGQASVFNLGDPGAAACYFAASTNQLTLAEMDRLDGITIGTAAASKALIVDASVDISGINVLGATTANFTNVDAGASGTAGSVDVFPATASKGKLAITCTNQTGDTTVSLVAGAMAAARTITIPDPGAAASFVLSTGTSTATSATSTELNYVAGVTAGTAASSKAVVLGASGEIATITTATIGTANFSTAMNSTAAKLSMDFDDTTDGVVDVIDFSHTSSDNNATALDGIGLSFELENATGTSTVEEWASLDILSTTITDGSEDGDFVFSQMLAGTVTESMRIDSSDQSLTVGRNATDANGMYQLRLFPVTASKGSLRLQATANTGDTDVTITNAAQAGARTLTIPDGGNTTANFLLSQGAQTVVGAQTFTNLFSVDQDDENDGVRNNLTMSHTSSDNNATAADGVGISIKLENATGTSTVEEWFSIDFLSTTITDGSEDGDMVFNAMLGGAVSQAALIDASDQSFSLGANATDADGIHQLRIFPVTASKGSLLINSIANSDNYEVSIQNAAHGQATAYTIPDIGQATGNIVLLKASQTTAGELKRADLTEEALQIYGVPVYTLRQADGAVMGIAETAGDHYASLSSDVWLLVGEASQSETEVSESQFQFAIPPNYVAAGDCKIRVKHKVAGTGTLGTCTIDIEVFEQDGNGAIGADLVTTGATATSGTWATTDFVVTASGLVAGDIINVVITTSIQETGGANPLEAQVDGVAVLLDIKG